MKTFRAALQIHIEDYVFILLIAETYLNIFVTAPVDKEAFSGGFEQAGQNIYTAWPARVLF